jgi:hypothetical protein
MTLPFPPSSPMMPTYSCGSVFTSIATANTDVWELFGSANRVLYIHKFRFTLNKAAAGYVSVQLIKRSTANTGGAVTAQTVAPHDSQYPASIGVPNVVSTVRGALGTSVGTLRIENVFAILVGTSAIVDAPNEWVFGEHGFAPIVLRGATQGICFNLDTASVGCRIACEWSESTT